ncbi:hypothetical protein [Pinibacter aurantiacus]|uniref:DUF3828 domain-containing protein n=1 Tax=Pinibacter aurantiacus TaxID=2851599 RepID=A0A9E2SAL0_9BACT|nr:hypothetical protein [Pinibacter aurantiacus]MBV4356930.1 hypothetical protein [Pinibacter aurantiacus]
MKKITPGILFFLLLLCSCNQINNNTNAENKTDARAPGEMHYAPAHTNIGAAGNQTVPDFNVAPKFINKYVQAIAGPNGGPSSWVEHSSLLTENFKHHYRKFSKSGESLDIDPILDANFFPGNGFTILKADTIDGYVTLAGKGKWKDYQLVLKLAQQENNWLVDGAGAINIPEEKRAKR